MNDVFNRRATDLHEENIVDDDDGEVTTTSEINQVNHLLDGILNDLVNHAKTFHNKVSLIRDLQSTGKFKHISKATRNELMQQLLDEVNALEEVTKITFRNLKKVKRERPDEDIVDQLIIQSVTKNETFPTDV